MEVGNRDQHEGLVARSACHYEVCDAEQTTTVKSSKLSLGFDVYCMACRLCFAVFARRRDRTGTGLRFNQPTLEATSADNRGTQKRKVHSMLYTIAVVLVVLWLLGLVSSVTMGGFIHILLVAAIIMILFNVISGRRSA